MLVLFIVVYLLVALFFIFHKSKKFIINPLFWLGITWGLIFGLYLSSGISYPERIPIYVYIYLISSGLVFIIAFYFGKRVIIFTKSTKSNQLIKKKHNTNMYFFISLTGLAMWLVDVLIHNDINIGYRIENYNITSVGSMGAIFLYASLIVWLYELSYTLRYNTKIKITMILSAIIYILPSIITAGRQALLIFSFATLIVIVYSFNIKISKKLKKRLILLMIFVISGFVVYNMFISSTRYKVDNKVALFEYMLQSNTSQETINFVNSMGVLADVTLDVIYYYSHELPSFSLFFENYNEKPLLGIFQFHYIGRRIASITNIASDSPWVQIENYSYYYGINAHTWRTAIASFIIDYGKTGAFLFVFLLGLLSGNIYSMFLKNKSIYKLLLVTFVCVGMVFTIQYSPFSEISWVYPLFWLILLPVLERLKLRSGDF